MYRGILNEMLDHNEAVWVRGVPMAAEVMGWSGVLLDASHNLVTSAERRLNYRHMIAEALFNLTTQSIDIMKRYNKGIVKFVADQERHERDIATWAYHPNLRSGLIYSVDCLRFDIHSRRAIATISPQHRAKGTPPCLSSLMFNVRDDKLNCIATMRSNDAWLGFPLDVFQFTLFQHLVAAALDLEVGWYQHNVGSMHLYERDREKAEKYIYDLAFRRIDTPVFALGREAWTQFHNQELYLDVIGLAARMDERITTFRWACDPIKGFGPLVNVLKGDYEQAHFAFKELHRQGVGIGW